MRPPTTPAAPGFAGTRPPANRQAPVSALGDAAAAFALPPSPAPSGANPPAARRKAPARPLRLALAFLAVWLGGLGAASAQGLADVSGQVALSFSGNAKFDRGANVYTVAATLANTSATAITPPLRLAVTGATQGAAAALAAADGQTADGQPYVTVHLADRRLDPGDRVFLLLTFNNPFPAPRFGLAPAPIKLLRYTVYGVLPGGNHPPVADAGPDRPAAVGQTVTLDASASTDADGDALGYRWALAQKPADSLAELDAASGLNTRLTLDRPGDYIARLVVDDGQADSAPDAVAVTTGNVKPVADAGPGQTAAAGQTVTLDGGASADADGDPLSYHWLLRQRPSGSAAGLSSVAFPNRRMHLTLDQPGHYEVGLTVADPRGGVSAPDWVAIDTANSAPVADAGPDTAARAGDSVALDGGRSADADADPLAFKWSLLGKPAGSAATLLDAAAPACRLQTDVAGEYVVQLIVDDGTLASAPDTAKVAAAPNHAPAITSTPAAQATAGQLYQYPVQAADADGDSLRYALAQGPAGMRIDAQTGLLEWTPGAGDTGPRAVSVSVEDGRGGAGTQSFDLTVSPPDRRVAVPTLAGLSRAAAESALARAKLGVGGLSFQHDAGVAEGLVLRQTPAAGAKADPGSAVSLAVSLGADLGLPPNPAVVAPPLDPAAVSTVQAATEFLYAGANPVQTGVAPGTIDAKRAAVVRGRVLDTQGQPLPGVAVSVKNHPEFGQTLSRADGGYDLAVNGGVLTLDYAKAGHLPAQAQADAPWQGFRVVGDRALVALSQQATAVSLGAGQPAQAAQGPQVTDQDGSRQATVLFPAGAAATLAMPDGSTRPLTTAHVRATEYSVGPDGPKAMPGPLPPTSGYTYAVELSVDEAMAAGAAHVAFDRPVPVYVDNFLGFPVGEAVPAGWYDRGRAAWIPADNGRVVKITGVAGGLAEIDADGDGQADSAAQLAALGVDAGEQAQLARLWPAGKTLWRVPVRHFSPWDFNWPIGPPAGAVNPSGIPRAAKSCGCPTRSGGSVVENENRALGEALPATGTPYTLNYRSDRMPGYNASNTITIPLSGATLPASVQRIDLIVDIAGRSFASDYPAAPNQSTTFTWDGRDAYGRKLAGVHLATVRVAYAYAGVFERTSRFGFGAGSGGGLTVNFTTREARLWSEHEMHIGAGNGAPEPAVGGWSLSAHHAFSPLSRTLFKGDGSTHTYGEHWRMELFAGGGGDRADGADRLAAKFDPLTDIDVAADGSVYLSSFLQIKAIGPDGKVRTVAGKTGGVSTIGAAPGSNDGQLAAQVGLGYIKAFKLGRQGEIYLLETGTATGAFNAFVRRIRADGRMETVFAFPGTFAGAPLYSTTDLGVGADGSVYVSHAGGDLLTQTAPDGATQAIASGGHWPSGVNVKPDGTVYFSLTYGGTLKTISPAGRQTDLRVPSPLDVTWDPYGDLFIASALGPHALSGIYRLRGDSAAQPVRISGPPDALVPYSPAPADGAALAKTFFPTRILRYSENLGGLLAVVEDDNRVWLIKDQAAPGLGYAAGEFTVADPGGREVYTFTREGRHLKTQDALTGAVTHRFGYDAEGRLVRVEDGDGDVTTIERDALGHPAALVSADGLRTGLAVDADGRLASAANPAGDTHRMEYAAGGLLARFEDPEGHAATFRYDALGLLTEDRDAEGHAQALTQTALAEGREIARATPLGRATRYRSEWLAGGGQRRSVQGADGLTSGSLENADGSTTTTSPDGTATASQQSPDPRFGMAAPITASQTVSSGGKTLTQTHARAVVLADPADPLSLATLTDTFTLNGRTAKTVYTAAGRTATATSPAGRQASLSLDAQGRPLQTAVPGLLDVRHRYDARGRLTRIAQGVGADERAVDYGYDARGWLETATGPLGVARHRRDAAGRVTQTTLPDGRAVEYQYDRAGRLTEITPPGRTAHTFSHTPRDLPDRYTPPLAVPGGETAYHYTADRELDRVTRPDGQALDFGYDSAGRLQTLSTPDGTATYAYHPTTGHLSQIAAADATLAFTYSGALLTQTQWTGAIQGTLGYGYDNDFRVNEIKVNGANPISYGYDPDGLLTTAGALTLSRDAQNGLLTGTALGQVSDSRTHTGFGETKTYAAQHGAAGLFATRYTYDTAGRITRKTETVPGASATYEYAYDPASRLAEVRRDGVVTATYGYDANGNRTHVNGVEVAAYDGQDRLTTYNGTTYTYTANGELESKTALPPLPAGEGRGEGVGGLTTRYRYDLLGNLRQVTLPGGTVIDYAVDGENRRIGKKVNGVPVQGFLWQDGLKIAAELDASHQVVARYVYATRANVPDYMLKGGQTYRLVTDHLGSPRLIVNATTGEVAQRMDYDDWGRVTLDTNPGFQPFGYAGGLYDRDTGLVRFGARDYDPETGRWTAKDPILFAGGDSNLYGYVAGNPVNWVDPTGKVVILPWIAACAADPLCWIPVTAVVASCMDKTKDILFSRPKIPPDIGPPNSWIQGPRRGRQYGPDGKPLFDIDKPHQGNNQDHVHEWPGGVREEPGRPVSPIPAPPESASEEEEN